MYSNEDREYRSVTASVFYLPVPTVESKEAGLRLKEFRETHGSRRTVVGQLLARGKTRIGSFEISIPLLTIAETGYLESQVTDSIKEALAEFLKPNKVP